MQSELTIAHIRHKSRPWKAGRATVATLGNVTHRAHLRHLQYPWVDRRLRFSSDCSPASVSVVPLHSQSRTSRCASAPACALLEDPFRVHSVSHRIAKRGSSNLHFDESPMPVVLTFPLYSDLTDTYTSHRHESRFPLRSCIFCTWMVPLFCPWRTGGRHFPGWWASPTGPDDGRSWATRFPRPLSPTRVGSA
jgi:hypothetical protein